MLDPFEEQFDLPAGLIDVSNGAGGQCKVVGQEYVMDARMGVFVANTTKPDGAIFCPGAGELNRARAAVISWVLPSVMATNAGSKPSCSSPT